MTFDPCASSQIKGVPSQVFSGQTQPGISNVAVDCTQANAVSVQVFVAGMNPSVTVQLLGASEAGGIYLPLPDFNARQTLTASKSFDVIAGTRWVKAQLVSVGGSYAPGLGITVYVTPFVSPGSPRVAASIVCTDLSAVNTKTGSLDVSGALVVGPDGAIRSGQTDFDAGIGYWLGYGAGVPKLSIGDSAGNKLTWDGSTLTVNGAVVTGAGSSIDGGYIEAATITASEIAAGTITAAQIAADTITADRLNVSELAAISANIGAAHIDGVLDIGAAGGIYQGAGTFDAPTTGLKVWSVPVGSDYIGLIAGYRDGVPQWAAATNGALTAGGGNVTLDADGVSIAAGQSVFNACSWYSGSNTVAKVFAYRSGQTDRLSLGAYSLAAAGETVLADISAWLGGAAQPSAQVVASGTYGDGTKSRVDVNVNGSTCLSVLDGAVTAAVPISTSAAETGYFQAAGMSGFYSGGYTYLIQYISFTTRQYYVPASITLSNWRVWRGGSDDTANWTITADTISNLGFRLVAKHNASGNVADATNGYQIYGNYSPA